MEYQNEEKIAHDVQSGGKRQKVQRTSGIAYSTQDAGTHIIEKQS